MERKKLTLRSPSPFRSAPDSAIGYIFFVKIIFRIFMRLLGGSRQFSYKLDIEYPMLKKIRGQFNIFENLYVTLENLHPVPILKKLRILK